MKPPSITVLLTLLDDAWFLPEWVETVRRLAPAEVVVVDGGSRDGGPEYLERRGLPGFRLYRRPMEEVDWHYSNQLNFAALHARADWVLLLDADEVLWPPGPDPINRALAEREDGVDLFWIDRYQLWPDERHRLDHGEFHDPQPRLWRREAGVWWKRKVHNLPSLQGVTLVCDHPACRRLIAPVILHRKDTAPQRLRQARHRRWCEHWADASADIGLPLPKHLPENVGPSRPLDPCMAQWRTDLMDNGDGPSPQTTTGDWNGLQREFLCPQNKPPQSPSTSTVAFSLIGMGLGDRIILEAPLRVHRRNRPGTYRIVVVEDGEGPDLPNALRRQFDELWRLLSADTSEGILRPSRCLNDALIEAKAQDLFMPFWNPLALPPNSAYRQSLINLFENARELQKEGVYPELPVGEADRNWARGLLSALGVDRFDWLVAIHQRQVVYGEDRNLETETIGAVMDTLRTLGRPAFLLQGRDDVPSPLTGADVFSFVGQRWPLEKTAAMLAEASLFIGGESGLTHAAAAVGLPVIGIGYVGWHAYPFTEAGRSLCFHKGEGLPTILAGVERFAQSWSPRPARSENHGRKRDAWSHRRIESGLVSENR